MQRLLLSLFALLTLTATAQNDSVPQPQVNDAASTALPQLRFGYLSYDAVLVSMPQYTIVQAKMGNLREAYNKEVKRVEDEFNQKYEAFLDGQRDFPRTILLKRQNELEELMRKNIEFRQQGRAELQKAEAEAMAPLHTLLREKLADVARKHGFAFVINTDANACPFIDTTIGESIQQEVINAISK